MKKEIEIRDGVVFVMGVTEEELKAVLQKYQQSKKTGEPFFSDIKIIPCPPESRLRRLLRRLFYG